MIASSLSFVLILLSLWRRRDFLFLLPLLSSSSLLRSCASYLPPAYWWFSPLSRLCFSLFCEPPLDGRLCSAFFSVKSRSDSLPESCLLCCDRVDNLLLCLLLDGLLLSLSASLRWGSSLVGQLVDLRRPFSCSESSLPPSILSDQLVVVFSSCWSVVCSIDFDGVLLRDPWLLWWSLWCEWLLLWRECSDSLLRLRWLLGVPCRDLCPSSPDW